MTERLLRSGDLVEVKSASEILASLDGGGALAGLPFMPEMVALCGRRLRVDKRAEKICDTIKWSGSRRLHDTVMLEDRRCDGSEHGGCQAECRFFWKEAWLRPVSSGDAPAAALSRAEDVAALLERTRGNTRRTAETPEGKAERHRCQATDLFDASTPLKLTDPRPYLRQLTSGNVPWGRFLLVMARATVQETRRKLGLLAEIPVKGPGKPHAEPPLDLQPGELVQVKSREEIALALNPQGRNKGLWFDREMLPYCGKTFRVRQRIHRFIDDQTGKMIELKSDCVTLETVVCSGDRSVCRWFCPRAIYPYWRESWLRRVEAPSSRTVDTRHEAERRPA